MLLRILHLRLIEVLYRLDALQARWIAETVRACYCQCLLMSVEQLGLIRRGQSGQGHWTYTVDRRLGSMPSIALLVTRDLPG